jgi:hypothetical protein
LASFQAILSPRNPISCSKIGQIISNINALNSFQLLIFHDQQHGTIKKLSTNDTNTKQDILGINKQKKGCKHQTKTVKALI